MEATGFALPATVSQPPAFRAAGNQSPVLVLSCKSTPIDDSAIRRSELCTSNPNGHTLAVPPQPPYTRATAAMAARARDAHRYSSRDRGARVPSKIVDKNTGKAYRTGKMLGKVRLRSLPIALRSARAPAAGRARAAAAATGPAVRLLSCSAFRAQGGFATAYQCTCVSSGKEKAVKVVSRASIRDSKSKQKVRRHAAARPERPARRLSLIRPRCCSNCTPRSRSTRPSRRRTPTPTSSTSWIGSRIATTST